MKQCKKRTSPPRTAWREKREEITSRGYRPLQMSKSRGVKLKPKPQNYAAFEVIKPGKRFINWKVKSCDLTLRASEFFNQVMEEGRTPSDWSDSLAEYSNNCSIRLLSRIAKIFDCILGK